MSYYSDLYLKGDGPGSFTYTNTVKVHNLEHVSKTCLCCVLPWWCCDNWKGQYHIQDSQRNYLYKDFSKTMIDELMVNRGYTFKNVEKCEANHVNRGFFKINNFTFINCILPICCFHPCNGREITGTNKDIAIAETTLRGNIDNKCPCCLCCGPSIACNFCNGENGNCCWGHDEICVCSRLLCCKFNEKHRCEVSNYYKVEEGKSTILIG